MSGIQRVLVVETLEAILRFFDPFFRIKKPLE
jgi:hypothetical protein